MPDQLHEDIEHVRPLIHRCLDEVKDLRTTFDRDRWWRRVGKVMVILAFVTSGLFWAYDQQQRCLRGNATRQDTRTAITAALAQAYRESGELPEREQAARVRTVEAVVVDAIPLRDC